MLQLVFDRAAIKHNINTVKKRAGKATIYAVLTADGYGAGLISLANLLRDDGISHFAVYDVADARALRDAGFVEEEILMLRSTTDPEELKQLLDLNVVCTVGSYETGVALNALAEERSTVALAHILIDTGTGMGGFLPSEPEKLISIYSYLSNIAITGTYTQLYAAGGDINGQMVLFQNTLDTLHRSGLDTGITHAADSTALIRSHGVQLDAVRVGSAFLGLCPHRKSDGLRTVCHGEATIDTVRWLPKGHTVGSLKQVRLKRPTRVAVIHCGIHNGLGALSAHTDSLLERLLFRRSSSFNSVRFEDTRLRLLGGAGETSTAVDATDTKCTAGDVVSFDINPLYARGMDRVFR